MKNYIAIFNPCNEEMEWTVIDKDTSIVLICSVPKQELFNFLLSCSGVMTVQFIHIDGNCTYSELN